MCCSDPGDGGRGRPRSLPRLHRGKGDGAAGKAEISPDGPFFTVASHLTCADRSADRRRSMASAGEVMTDAPEISVRCCIAGGGPAGMMLGFLLARAGISVLVVAKHADFLRDFRGDSVHPSTLGRRYEPGV